MNEVRKNLPFCKSHALAREPLHASAGAAGSDLYATSKLRFGNLLIYGTGISVEIPKGHYGLVLPRSSCVWTGLSMSCFAVDSDYRGEIKCAFFDMRRTEHERNGIVEYLMMEFDKSYAEAREMTGEYNVGDRIAQIIITPVTVPTWKEVYELSKSERGSGGYGSTGRG